MKKDPVHVNSIAERIDGRDMGRYHTIEPDAETLRPPGSLIVRMRPDQDCSSLCLYTSWRMYFLLQVSDRHGDFISITLVALFNLCQIS